MFMSEQHVLQSLMHDGWKSVPAKILALVYFSGPWENILTLWHYFKLYYYLTLPKQSIIIPFPNPTGGHQRPPFAVLNLLLS